MIEHDDVAEADDEVAHADDDVGCRRSCAHRLGDVRHAHHPIEV